MMSNDSATVFVVDDDAGVRKSLGRLMTACELRFETFASGPAFLDAIHPCRAGCLLLDLRLKEGSGLEVQDELGRRGIAIPIIVLTGHGTIPDSVRAMKAGAFDFLQKPPPPAVLVERIRAALDFDRIARAEGTARAEAAHRLSVVDPRQRDVLSMLIAGDASAQVASDLTRRLHTGKISR